MGQLTRQDIRKRYGDVEHSRVEAGQNVGLAPDASGALAFDAQHQLAA